MLHAFLNIFLRKFMTQYQTIVNMISIINFLSPCSAAVCRMISRCEVLSSIHFCQTSSVFSDPLDLLDHPLLLDIFSLGAPQLRTGLVFLFFFKVSFEKHPNAHSVGFMSKIGKCLYVFILCSQMSIKGSDMPSALGLRS